MTARSKLLRPPAPAPPSTMLTELGRRTFARKLSEHLMLMIPTMPSWELTRRAMAVNHRLMELYGYFPQGGGFVEYPRPKRRPGRPLRRRPA